MVCVYTLQRLYILSAGTGWPLLHNLVCGFIGLVVAGIDCIVVQGSEAGGHRGTFYTTDTDYRSVAGYTLLQNG